MPATPTAASTSPFSRLISPTTWLMALRRVIIISMPSSTTESASARSSRAIALAPAVIGNTTKIASATTATPAIMLAPMPSAVSTDRCRFIRRTMPRSARGISSALATKAMSAVRYSSGAPCMAPCQAAASASTPPCMAKALITACTRRWYSNTKLSSSMAPPSRWAMS